MLKEITPDFLLKVEDVIKRDGMGASGSIAFKIPLGDSGGQDSIIDCKLGCRKWQTHECLNSSALIIALSDSDDTVLICRNMEKHGI